MNPTRLFLTAALGAAVLATARPAWSQTYHLPATPEKGVWVEAAYADLETLSQSFPSTLWFVSGRLPLTSEIRAVADVPFAHSRMRFSGGSRASSTVLGNPFLGLEFARSGLVVETGLRVPLNTIDSESFADVMGVLGDFQRGEAFMDEVVPLSGAVTYEYGLARGASIRGRAGVIGLFYTGDDEDEEHDALIDYGVLGTYPVGSARFGLGYYGRWIASEDEGGFQDNSVHHVSLSADMKVRGVRPGVSVRVPVDKAYNDILTSTIGVYVQLPLR